MTSKEKRIFKLEVDSFGQQRLAVNEGYAIKAITPKSSKTLLINLAKD